MKKLLALILIAFLSGLHMQCTEFEEDENGTLEQELPDQESWNNNIYFTRDGKRRAVLTAGYIAKYNRKNITILKEGVKVDFYDDDGRIKSVLTSEEGKVYDDRQDMIATGQVVVRSNSGTTLYSEELHWKNMDEKIVSYVPVMITTDSDTLYGDTFRSDPDLVDYEITNTRGTSNKTISIDE
jgi:LPS export ABC transporter protein LptC